MENTDLTLKRGAPNTAVCFCDGTIGGARSGAITRQRDRRVEPWSSLLTEVREDSEVPIRRHPSPTQRDEYQAHARARVARRRPSVWERRDGRFLIPDQRRIRSFVSCSRAMEGGKMKGTHQEAHGEADEEAQSLPPLDWIFHKSVDHLCRSTVGREPRFCVIQMAVALGTAWKAELFLF